MSAGHNLFRLSNPIRDYAWGSRTFIQQLLADDSERRAEPNAPAAELWHGAHPAAPSQLAGMGMDLSSAIAQDPVTMLGRRTAERFGNTLPFLMKVLAADQALSIQAHPTLAQAQSGFAEEQMWGIALDAPERNYVDPNHKPELICALTDFDALCGFRTVGETLDFLAALIAQGAAELTSLRERLSDAAALPDVVAAILRWPSGERAAVIGSLARAAARIAQEQGRWAPECEWICRLAREYPEDTGVVLSLLMNLVRLGPGQAIFLAAGQIHAYLRGAGIEILAASDNVLRGGLTPKHIDVEELLRILDFTAGPVSVLVPRPVDPDRRRVRFEVPVDDFCLERIILPSGVSMTIEADGPRILLCVQGEIELRSEGEQLQLQRGESVFVPADRDLELDGAGELFLAAPGPRVVF